MFPQTRLTVLARAKSDDPSHRAEAWRHLATVYQRPIYLHLRLKWGKSQAEAQDLTQHFFLRAVERDFLGGYEPTKGRFRAFVRVSLDRLVINAAEAERAQKRGGGAAAVDLDVADLELSVASARHQDPDRVFEQQWAKAVLDQSIATLQSQLEEEGRGHQFEAFRRYDLVDEQPTYAEVAEAMGVSTSDVTNYLHAARKRFRAVALETLGELTSSEEELRAEALELLGIRLES